MSRGCDAVPCGIDIVELSSMMVSAQISSGSHDTASRLDRSDSNVPRWQLSLVEEHGYAADNCKLVFECE
jgi:hypothetical protein